MTRAKKKSVAHTNARKGAGKSNEAKAHRRAVKNVNTLETFFEMKAPTLGDVVRERTETPPAPPATHAAPPAAPRARDLFRSTSIAAAIHGGESRLTLGASSGVHCIPHEPDEDAAQLGPGVSRWIAP